MDLEIYRSHLIMPALGICIGACIHLLKEQRNLGALLMLVGFSLVTITNFSINYCVGSALLDLNLDTIMCSNFIPDINGAGYVLIALGILKFTQAIKNA